MGRTASLRICHSVHGRRRQEGRVGCLERLKGGTGGETFLLCRNNDADNRGTLPVRTNFGKVRGWQ